VLIESDRQGMHRSPKRSKLDMTGEQLELESLERVSWRLVNTSEDRLGDVLSKLLPIMVDKLDEHAAHIQVRQKILDILAHVNARLKGSPPGMVISVIGIWDAYQRVTGPVAKNIAMLYLAKAFERCPQDERSSLVHKIVPGISQAPREHQGKLLMHLFAISLSGYSSTRTESENILSRLESQGAMEDVDVVLNHAKRLMLYIPSKENVPQTMPGLSRGDVEEMVKVHQFDTLEQTQLGVLEYIYKADLPPKKVMALYLCAASSPATAVAKKGEMLMAKNCVVDTARPTVDIEDEFLLKQLFELYFGDVEDESVPENARKAPASRLLQGRIVSLLCKSTAACNMNPESTMVIHDCLFSGSSGVSSQQQGMEFAVHVLRHANTLSYLAPFVIQHALRILETSQGNANLNSLRGFAYQSLGQLAQRAPETLEEKKLELASSCFEALRFEPPGVRASVQETINCLANCFTTRTDLDQKTRVRDMLTQYVKGENSTVRQAALQWWIWIFPFDDCSARFHCILLCSDPNINISDLAREGIDRDKVAAFQRAKGFTASLSTDSADLAGPAWPSTQEMLVALSNERPSLIGHRRSTKVDTLAMPSKSMEAMVEFLHQLSEREERNSLLQEGTLQQYFSVLASCIAPYAPTSLNSVALDSLLLLTARFGQEFLVHFMNGTNRFESMLQHSDMTVACKSARLLGFLGKSMDPPALKSLVGRLHGVLSECREKPKKQEDYLGPIYASGFIVAWAGDLDNNTKMLVEDLCDVAFMVCSKDRDMIRSVAVLALGYSSLGLQLKGEHTDTLIEHSTNLIRYSHKDIPIHIAEALGLIGMTETDEQKVQAIVDEILNQNNSKVEKLLETCGRSLALIWGDSEKNKKSLLLSSSCLSTQGPGTIGTNAAPTEVRNYILRFIVNQCISNTRSESRLAGASWLLSLVENVAKTPEISENIAEIQQAFCMLLGDSNDRTQELASRGVTTSYQYAPDEAKSQLVDSLVGILSGSGGGKWMRPNNVEEDTQIFEPGTLGSLPDQGGNISTYKEICSLATDLGQPDLIYQFMNLAASQAAADASRGAAYGMASVAAIAGNELRVHVQKLIPRLYRSTFDPNPLVRESMRHIWVVLVDDQREALRSHLAAILSMLPKDMTRQQWRVRESAALAMADILQGLTWPEVKDYFAAIVKSCFRVIDDVKESVAIAGQALARAISSLSVRLVDSESTKSVDSKEFMGVMFSLLTTQGITSEVPVVRAFSIDMIAKLTKSSGREAVQGSMHVVVPPLLEALSGMEDSRFNYLEQHVHRLGVDGNRFEEERIRFSQTSPIADTLDLCAKHITASTFCDLGAALTSFIRRAVGSATKAGTALFITSSVRRLGSDVRPVTFTLMKALHEASALESSASVRRGYASAFATLSKYAPRSKVDKMIDSWIISCKEVDSAPSSLLLTGTMLKAMSSEASDIFLRYANDVAPLAFMLQYESDTSISSMWMTVWEEVSTVTGSGIRGHVVSVTDMLLEALSSNHWGRKKAAGRGLVYLGENSGDRIGSLLEKIIDGLLNALSGRIWDGKEILLESLSAVVLGADTTFLTNSIVQQTFDAYIKACQKQSSVYRMAALVELGRVAKHLSDTDQTDYYPAAWPVLQEIVACAKDTPIEEKEDKGNTRSQLSVAMDCIASFWHGQLAASRESALTSSTMEVLNATLQNRCKSFDDQKSTLHALDELTTVIDLNHSTLTGKVTTLADSLVSIIALSKAEHNRLVAADILLRIVRGAIANDQAEATIHYGTVLDAAVTQLRTHHDKSTAVSARIEEILIAFDSHTRVYNQNRE
jgi:proteasome component ECM29